MPRFCAVSWCVALVAPGLTRCAIHQRFGKDYQPAIELEPCTTCGSSRECETCRGTGEHECGCGTIHECGECDGTGHCPACQDPAPPALSDHERAYVAWSLSDGLRPCPPFFSGVHVRLTDIDPARAPGSDGLDGGDRG